MNRSSFCALALLAAGSLALAQNNNLFNVTTTGPTAPAPKATSGGRTNGVPQPIEVLAEGRGIFSLKEEYAEYHDNVRVNDPEFFLRCESLRLNLDLKAAKGTNAVPPAATNLTNLANPGTNAPGVSPLISPMGGRVRSALALGNVYFSNKLDLRLAFADRMDYQASNDVFTLTGNARIIQGTITNNAPVIYYYRTEGRLEAVGNVQTVGTYAGKTNSPAAKTNAAPVAPAPAPAPAPKKL
jgi:hypothetical protein